MCSCRILQEFNLILPLNQRKYKYIFEFNSNLGLAGLICYAEYPT